MMKRGRHHLSECGSWVDGGQVNLRKRNKRTKEQKQKEKNEKQAKERDRSKQMKRRWGNKIDKCLVTAS
jgi:hypothetical protein